MFPNLKIKAFNVVIKMRLNEQYLAAECGKVNKCVKLDNIFIIEKYEGDASGACGQKSNY